MKKPERWMNGPEYPYILFSEWMYKRKNRRKARFYKKLTRIENYWFNYKWLRH